MEKLEKKKIGDFLYYYKFHIVAVLFVVLVAVILIQSLMERDDESQFTIVDWTSELSIKTGENLISEFSKVSDIDAEHTVYTKSATLLQDNEKMENLEGLMGVKNLTQRIEAGYIDIMFVYRTQEYDTEVVGNIEEILPSDLYERLSEYIVYQRDENGETNYDVPIGLMATKSKKFIDVFGECEYNIVIQIPENAIHLEKSIEFVKFLYALY